MQTAYLSLVGHQQTFAASGLPSTLLVFGNPPLGTLFLASNPDSGLDWPARLLVRQDANGDVWAVYTDSGWIAR